MTDQWIPGPGCAPVPPDGIPPANTWTPADSCAPPSGPSITGGVVITGVPATIVAPYAWGITLNDGSAPPNFSIDHFDSTGALIDSPIIINGASGDVTVTHDPTQPLGVATKEYVDSHSAGVTEAPIDGQLYGRQNEGWTVVPPPAVQEAPTDGQAYVRQASAWAPLTAQLTGYMPISGGTFTGAVYFTAANGVLVQGAAGTPRAILGVTGNAARWQMILGDTTAESGANAGSNFALNAIGDTGALLSTPLAIARSTGAITVNTGGGVVPLTINGPAGSWRSIAGATNGSMRWQMYLGNPTGELGSNFGSNFVLNSYTDAGVTLGTPLQIARQTGVATFSALPSFPGGAAGNVLSTNGAGALSWIAPSGGGIADAPNDGTAYARKSAAWANLAHTDITDWTATLAPYALTTSVPVASTTTPLMDGTAAVGTAATWARANHVHPSDTSRLPLTGGTVSGNLNVGGQLQVTQANGVQYGGSAGIAFQFVTVGTQNVFYAYSGGVQQFNHVQGYGVGNSAPVNTLGYVSTGPAGLMNMVNGTQVTFAVSTSDRKLKTNIGDAARSGLETVAAFDVRQFDMSDQHWDFGLIADEVEPVMRSAFIPAFSDQGYQGLQPLPLIAMLIKAVQELTARIEALEATR